MTAPAAPRRLLFVDHVSRILGGAEVNLVELLAPRPPAPTGEATEAWLPVVACDPDGPLHGALSEGAVPGMAYRIAPALGTLRTVGRSFPLAGALRGLRALASARRNLSRLVTEVRPDVVVSCTNKDHFAAWPACRRAGIPSVWWVNDIVSSDFFPWLARRAFHFQARRGASRLVVVSRFARDVLVREGFPADRIRVVHNGIPLERYRTGTRRLLRDRLNVADDEPLVGIVGRFTPWKGQRLFLELAQAWCRDRPRGRFALVGHAFNEDQAYEGELRDFLERHGLAERVHLVPFQRDIAAALADLDVLVHASLRPEPFGRVLIEAMSVGVPVLAARDGGVPEIVTHDVDGLLARPGDLGEYEAALRRLLDDATLRERLRSAARETVARRFSLTRVRTEFDRLFAELSS